MNTTWHSYSKKIYMDNNFKLSLKMKMLNVCHRMTTHKQHKAPGLLRVILRVILHTEENSHVNVKM